MFFERLFNLSEKFKRVFFILMQREAVKNSAKHYFSLMKKNNIKIRKLSGKQKKEVDSIYGKYKRKFYGQYDYLTHELYYSATGQFNPYVLPESLYRTKLVYFMNKRTVSKGWADKNYFEAFHPNAKFPEAIVHNVEGKWMDPSYNLISKEQVSEILQNSSNVIVKSSLDSFQGKGVAFFEKTNIDELVKNYKKNFIVQKKFIQHKDISLLNESSVNVIRVISVFIDEEPSIIMSALRVGKSGALIDVSPDENGNGNVIIGIDNTGKLNPYGYSSSGKKVQVTSNGFEFAGFQVPGYQKVCKVVCDVHKKMPMFKMIGWDIVIDEHEEVVIMEYNLMCPGVLYYQWVNGPLFGEDKEKILSVIEKLGKK